MDPATGTTKRLTGGLAAGANCGAAPEAPMAWSTCGLPPTACPLRHSPHTRRSPIGSSTQGPRSRVHTRPPAQRMFMSAHPSQDSRGGTKHVRGMPTLTCGGRGAACGSYYWSHGAFDVCADMDMWWVGRRMWPCHWGQMWSSMRGHGTCEGCAEIDMRRAGGRMWTLLLGPSVEFPMGPRRARGVCRNGHAVGGGPHVASTISHEVSRPLQNDSKWWSGLPRAPPRNPNSSNSEEDI